jgi:hypothetical protein
MSDAYTRTAGPALEAQQQNPTHTIWWVRGKGFICALGKPTPDAVVARGGRCGASHPSAALQCDLNAGHVGAHQAGGVNVWQEWDAPHA